MRQFLKIQTVYLAIMVLLLSGALLAKQTVSARGPIGPPLPAQRPNLEGGFETLPTTWESSGAARVCNEDAEGCFDSAQAGTGYGQFWIQHGGVSALQHAIGGQCQYLSFAYRFARYGATVTAATRLVLSSSGDNIIDAPLSSVYSNYHDDLWHKWEVPIYRHTCAGNVQISINSTASDSFVLLIDNVGVTP